MTRPVLRLPLLAALVLALAPALPAAIPLVDPPQPLRDAEGNPEVGLVNPFTPRAEGAADPGLGESGLTRTSLGDLPADFRILGIAIPEGEGARPSALIRMGGDEEPTLVHEGDQVRVSRDPSGVRRRAAGRRGAAPEPSAADRYTFYLYVKTISPTYLEVYHSKKRPDETLILRW